MWRNLCDSETEIPYWLYRWMFTNYKSGSPWLPNATLFNFSFLLSILVKCCVHLQTSSSKTQMLLLEKNIIIYHIECFAIDSQLDICLKLSQWAMLYNSIARTHGAYNETWIEVFIECCHTWRILQTYQTGLQQIYFGTCLYHCSSIKLLYIHGLLHGTSCFTHNNNNFLGLWHITLY